MGALHQFYRNKRCRSLRNCLTPKYAAYAGIRYLCCCLHMASVKLSRVSCQSVVQELLLDASETYVLPSALELKPVTFSLQITRINMSVAFHFNDTFLQQRQSSERLYSVHRLLDPEFQKQTLDLGRSNNFLVRYWILESSTPCEESIFSRVPNIWQWINQVPVIQIGLKETCITRPVQFQFSRTPGD